MKLVKKELTTPVEIVATCWTFRFCRVMRGAVRFCVAWMTRPVTTSPWIALDAVRELAFIPNAWTLDMVVKPLIFRAPLMLPDTLRLVVLIVDAVRVLAVIPNAWTLDMVVKPVIFRAPLMLPDTLRLVVLIVDAPSLTKFATAFGLAVIILPPCPNAPRKRFEVIPAVVPFKVLKSP